ncbi:MAG: 30S ribosome-binding factor RbfA [Bacteroidota bacterium]|nr:30S ribosome-binding factor RbfA [Bacteroidota bacterium]
MDTTRQNKVNRLMQKELSEIFLVQTRATHGMLVTVSEVKVSPDLSTARVYLSIFPKENNEEVLKNIQKSTKTIRHELAEKLRFQLRRMPELTFYLDETLDYAETIDALLNKINQR